MKITELTEMVSSGAISADAIAGHRQPLFSRTIKRTNIVNVNKLFKKRKNVNGIPKITFKQMYGNNIKG